MDIKRTFSQYINSKEGRASSLLIILLLSADFMFIVLHIIHQRSIPILRSPLYDIGQDLGYGEFYQYLKYFWIILLLIYILKTTRNVRFIPWILVFLYFLLDDSFQIHEKIGGLIATHLPQKVPFDLDDQDYGELIVNGVFGILFFILITWSYWRGSQIFKKTSIDLIIFISALVFFGVIMDMVHGAVKSGWVIEESLGMIEDGGEMVVVSITLWYVFLLASCKGCPELFLYEELRRSKKSSIHPVL